jgi:hypothetical protein
VPTETSQEVKAKIFLKQIVGEMSFSFGDNPTISKMLLPIISQKIDAVSIDVVDNAMGFILKKCNEYFDVRNS